MLAIHVKPPRQTFHDLTTVETGSATGEGWRAASLEFEIEQAKDITVRHKKHMLFCAPDSRSSSSPRWRWDSDGEFHKGPLYLLLPVNVDVTARFEPGEYRALIFEFDDKLLRAITPVSLSPPNWAICGLNTTTHHLIRLTLEELTGGQADSMEISQDLVQCLLVCAARMSAQPRQQGYAIEPSEAVEETTAQIMQNVRANRPALVGMSDLTGMSERHLQRKFRDEMGMSLQDYAANFRIELAREMLSDPELALKTIGYSLGYANPSHFTRSFKAATGMTPSAFRRNLLKD